VNHINYITLTMLNHYFTTAVIITNDISNVCPLRWMFQCPVTG